WEQNGFANTSVAEKHNQTVDAQTDTTHWRGTVLQCTQEGFVKLHGFWVSAGSQQGLLGQALTLDDRVDQLGEGGTAFHPADDQVPGFDNSWLRAVRTCQRLCQRRVVAHEGRVDQGRLNDFAEQF